MTPCSWTNQNSAADRAGPVVIWVHQRAGIVLCKEACSQRLEGHSERWYTMDSSTDHISSQTTSGAFRL